MFEKVKSLFNFSSLLICFLILGSVYIGVIENSNIKYIWFVIVLLILLILFLLLGEREYKQIFITGFCMMIVCQLFCSYLLMPSYETWDLSIIRNNVVSFVTTGDLISKSYFARYPNNLMILYILIIYYKIIFSLFGSTSIYWGVLLNIFSIDLSIYFTIKIAKYIVNERSYIVGIISLFFTPFYLWTPIIYTDTLCLPILTGNILLLFKIANNHSVNTNRIKENCKNCFMFSIAGALMYFGYLIKGSLAILIIATLLYLFFKFDIKKFCLSSMGIIAGITLMFLLWNGEFRGILISEDLFQKNEFPYTHFIMMGLHDSGNYNPEDVTFTMSFETYEEKLDNTSEMIISWIETNKISGLLQQMYKKATHYGWNYGTYYAERYLGDSGDVPRLPNILHEFVLTKGRYHKIFRYYTQSYYLLLLGMAILSYIITIIFHKKDYEVKYLQLSLTGCCIFFMIWETHPRYMFHFSLIMLLLATYTLNFILNWAKAYYIKGIVDKKDGQ